MPSATNNSLRRGFLLSNKPIVLWIHDTGAISNHDAVVNPEMFPNFRDGQLLRILCPRISQPLQSQNNSKSDQQDGKKLDSSTPQQQQQQTQQQQQQQQGQQQQQQAEQTNAQPQQSQSSDKQDHLEQLDFVIVKGHAADKEILAKQQQLQVKTFTSLNFWDQTF